MFDLSERLRTRGWLVPAYTFPANLEHIAVLRIVVRNGFSHDLADLLLTDLQRHVRALAAHPRSHVPLAPADSGSRSRTDHSAPTSGHPGACSVISEQERR